jgi:hypothetical protein
MLIVVTLGTDGAEFLIKFLGTHDLRHGLILTSNKMPTRNIK